MLNFFESKVDIIKALEATGDFLTKQMNFDMSKPSNLHSDPTFVGIIDQGQKVSIAAEIVIKYKDHLVHKMEELKRDIATIKVKISFLLLKFSGYD